MLRVHTDIFIKSIGTSIDLVTTMVVTVGYTIKSIISAQLKAVIDAGGGATPY